MITSIMKLNLNCFVIDIIFIVISVLFIFIECLMCFNNMNSFRIDNKINTNKSRLFISNLWNEFPTRIVHCLWMKWIETRKDGVMKSVKFLLENVMHNFKIIFADRYDKMDHTHMNRCVWKTKTNDCKQKQQCIQSILNSNLKISNLTSELCMHSAAMWINLTRNYHIS